VPRGSQGKGGGWRLHLVTSDSQLLERTEGIGVAGGSNPTSRESLVRGGERAAGGTPNFPSKVRGGRAAPTSREADYRPFKEVKAKDEP
jgi:hypothetical protein